MDVHNYLGVLIVLHIRTRVAILPVVQMRTV